MVALLDFSIDSSNHFHSNKKNTIKTIDDEARHKEAVGLNQAGMSDVDIIYGNSITIMNCISWSLSPPGILK